MKKKWFLKLRNLTFVTPCEWMLAPLKQSFLGNNPARVIVNGVNRANFYPISSDLRKQYRLENQKICLSVASEWDHRKGLNYLIEAAEKMGEGYRFVVIGLDDAQIAALPQNMIGICRTSNITELAQWYTVADCFVNPTLEDNMPMVNLEALACGTPVVTFATGGCPEAIDENCGIIVPQHDLNALCEAIEKTASGTFSAEECFGRAQLFDSHITFQSYLKLYKELCQ